MRAMLLAAGFGTRLKPLTDTIPKCLVPINGTPLLKIWLDQLYQSNVREFLVNTHYLPEIVESFIKESPYKSITKLVYERVLHGTAGTLISNLDFFQGQDGLLIHADNYCLDNFIDFYSTHFSRPSECLLTMMIFVTEQPSTCGIVELDQRGIVVGFHEKKPNPPGNLANGAIYIISAELLGLIGAGHFKGASDFSIDILPKLLGKIYTYKTNAPLIDIGTPDAYERANR